MTSDPGIPKQVRRIQAILWIEAALSLLLTGWMVDLAVRMAGASGSAIRVANADGTRFTMIGSSSSGSAWWLVVAAAAWLLVCISCAVLAGRSSRWAGYAVGGLGALQVMSVGYFIPGVLLLFLVLSSPARRFYFGDLSEPAGARASTDN